MDPLLTVVNVTALAILCCQIIVLCNQAAGRHRSIRRTLISLRTEIVAYQAYVLAIQAAAGHTHGTTTNSMLRNIMFGRGNR